MCFLIRLVRLLVTMLFIFDDLLSHSAVATDTKLRVAFDRIAEVIPFFFILLFLVLNFRRFVLFFYIFRGEDESAKLFSKNSQGRAETPPHGNTPCCKSPLHKFVFMDLWYIFMYFTKMKHCKSCFIAVILSHGLDL